MNAPLDDRGGGLSGSGRPERDGHVPAGPGDTDETPSSPDRAAYEGFCLALRLMYLLYAPETPGSEAERPWEVVREIAEGELSLSNPGDLGARFPNLRDFVSSRANEVVARERDVAGAVLRGLQEAL